MIAIGAIATLILAMLAAFLTGQVLLVPAIAIAALGGMALWRWPMLGVFFVIIAEAFVPLRESFGGLTAPKLVGAALAAILILKLTTGRINPANLQSPIWWAVGGLLFVMAFGLFRPSADVAQATMIDLGTALVVVALLLAFREDLDFDWFARAFAGALTIACLLQFFVDASHPENGRPTGFTGDPNVFAILLVAVFPLTVYLAWCERAWLLRALWWGACVLLVLSMIETLSRSGAVVALATMFLAAFLLRAHVKQIHVVAVSVMAALTIVTGISLAPPAYQERILSLSEISFTPHAGSDRSLGRRAAYWIVGTRMISDSPVVGQGAGTYPYHFARSEYAAAFHSAYEMEGFYRQAHNTYLEAAAELGVLGLAALLGAVWISWRCFMNAHQLANKTHDARVHGLVLALSLSFFAIAFGLFFFSSMDNKIFWAMTGFGAILADRVSLFQREIRAS